MPDPTVAVGILTYNGRAFVEACLASVLAQTPAADEFLVVDNASTDTTPDVIAARYPQVPLVRNDTNVGVALGLNQLVAATTAPIVVLLNQDIELRPGALAAISDAFADPQVGVVGIKLLYPDGRTVQHAGGWLEWPLYLAQHHGYGQPDDGRWDTPAEVDVVTGAVFAVRRAAWDALGGLSDLFSPAYFEETDFCLRAWGAAWKVVYAPAAVAIHHESTTLGQGSRRYLDLYHRHRLRLILRHASIDHLLTYFARAEARRTAHLRPMPEAADEVAALTAAYADARRQWPTLAATRGDAPLSPGAMWAIDEMLTALHGLAETRGDADDWKGLVLPSAALLRTRDAILASDPTQVVAELRPNAAATNAALTAAAAAQTVHEQPFRSDAPLVGPQIAWARDSWNSVSTKWYVRPLLEQQNRFNAAVTTALHALTEAIEGRDDLEIRLSDALREMLRAMEAMRTVQDGVRFDLDALHAREDARYAELAARLDALAGQPPTTDDQPPTTDDDSADP